MRPPASATAVGDPGSLAPYWRFHQAVAEAQLASWLPRGSQVLIDISGPRACAAQIAAAAGHTVLRVAETVPGTPDGFPPGSFRADGSPAVAGPAQGKIVWLTSDPRRLSFLADGCADGVIAEDRALSMQLAAETLIADIARVLRPAGRVLACVDSLVLGMALLAEQRHWAELTDLPYAEVVLVPWPDGTITRCFGAEQLRELFHDAGFTVAWIRPRTMLSPSTVTHVLRRDPAGLRRLVDAELAMRPDESVGVQLVVSARKRARKSGHAAVRRLPGTGDGPGVSAGGGRASPGRQRTAPHRAAPQDALPARVFRSRRTVRKFPHPCAAARPAPWCAAAEPSGGPPRCGQSPRGWLPHRRGPADRPGLPPDRDFLP